MGLGSERGSHQGGTSSESDVSATPLQGLVYSEVQRLQALLQETNETANQSESELKQRCGKLEGRVRQLELQLDEQHQASSLRPSPSGRFNESLNDSEAGASRVLTHLSSLPPFAAESDASYLFEGSDDEFWELSVIPDEKKQSNSDYPGEHDSEDPWVDAPLEDSAMDSNPIELKLVKLVARTPLYDTREDSGIDGEDPESCSSGSSLDLSKVEHLEPELRERDSYTDTSSLGGYTFSKHDMEALVDQGDALQSIVTQLSSALEQADDDKFHLEEKLRELIMSKALSFQWEKEAITPTDRARRLPQWMSTLPRQIRSLTSKHQSLYQELLRRLDLSRRALHQSQEAQNQLREAIEELRIEADALRTALSATEAELELCKSKVEMLESKKADPSEIASINEKLSSVEQWRLRSKKAVESSSSAFQPHQSYYEHLSRTSKSQIAEILVLREENQHLTTALANLSIQYAEADSKHTETKRALARREAEVESLLQKLRDATSEKHNESTVRAP